MKPLFQVMFQLNKFPSGYLSLAGQHTKWFPKTKITRKLCCGSRATSSDFLIKTNIRLVICDGSRSIKRPCSTSFTCQPYVNPCRNISLIKSTPFSSVTNNGHHSNSVLSQSFTRRNNNERRSCYSTFAFVCDTTDLNPVTTSSRHISHQGKHPAPKVPPSKFLKKHDIQGTIFDEESARQFIYALSPEERKHLQDELAHFHFADNQDSPSAKPTRKQLQQVAIHQMLPFIGFGFLDNFLMIVFGEYIDVTLGAFLGISTMAAAALGNLVSDIGGIGTASYVESLVSRLGVRPPRLTPEQIDMPSTKWSSNMGRVLGVTIGCLIGMFPLMFFDSRKEKEEKKQAAQKKD